MSFSIRERVAPAADALAQEVLGPSSVLALLLDISSDECFFHKRVLLILTGISEDLMFYGILRQMSISRIYRFAEIKMFVKRYRQTPRHVL